MDFGRTRRPPRDSQRTGDVETRPGRAETRPENLNPKTGMLGLTPAVVFIVVDLRNRIRSSNLNELIGAIGFWI